jgi:carboxymethylenebutenolidase
MPDVTIAAHDGGSFSAYVAEPNNTPGPGLVLIQYICGVNRVMRALADDFARQGYLVAVPDLFWRQEPGVQIIQDPANPSKEEFQKSLALNDGFQDEPAIKDLAVTLDFIRGHGACNGRAGTLGYCLGGRMAYLMAGHTDVDCAVSYYGVNLDKNLGLADKIDRPLLMHIAGKDALVPPPAREAIVSALASKSNVTIHVHEGVNHAFALPNGPNWNTGAASLANDESHAFLKKYLQD